MVFDWDDRKRQSNIEKHGIDFLDAILIFAGPTLIRRSNRPGEERFIATGKMAVQLIAVIFTDRGNDQEVVRRIISARRARANEEKEYRSSRGEA